MFWSVQSPAKPCVHQWSVDFSSLAWTHTHAHSLTQTRTHSRAADLPVLLSSETLRRWYKNFRRLLVLAACQSGNDDDERQQLLPHQRRWRHFRRLRHCGTVGRGGRVKQAQQNNSGIHVTSALVSTMKMWWLHFHTRVYQPITCGTAPVICLHTRLLENFPTPQENNHNFFFF